AEQQRKMLEVLMGEALMREAPLGGGPSGGLGGAAGPTLHYADPQVCRPFLCGLCPHTLFTNTKMDMGACPKRHSEVLRAAYQAAAGVVVPSAPAEWTAALWRYVAECDYKIQRGQRQLDAVAEDERLNGLQTASYDLAREIQLLSAAVVQRGTQGRVLEAAALQRDVDRLILDKYDIDGDLAKIMANEAGSQHQKLRVCVKCSALLSIFDSDRKLADHFMGKMHLGFVKIRDQLEALRAQ
ncbi:hypothetical protein CXG81DRAFT_5358, partial [Caulochytrium protostelioides]